MLALCLMLLATYYAQNYAGIIGWSLPVWLHIFHTIKVIVSDLRNCCSDEDLFTVPWSFFSSFIIFPFFLYLINNVRKSRKKVLIEVLHIQLADVFIRRR